MGTASGGEPGLCHRDCPNVPDGQVRDGAWPDVHPHRRRRDAAGVRPWCPGRVRDNRRREAPMTPPDPSATFEPHRRRLLGLAYRMLGSMAEAEDAVQETYLRWHDTDHAGVEDARAFLMTTTTRICLDVLKSARIRRETYVGPWLPDPVTDTAALAPDAQTELAEDLSVALLLALERLSPLERAAFLLHDVFDMDYADVAAALERSEAACRQLAARAREHVRATRPRFTAATDAQTKLADAFVAAVTTGDISRLAQLLADDVVLYTD